MPCLASMAHLSSGSRWLPLVVRQSLMALLLPTLARRLSVEGLLPSAPRSLHSLPRRSLMAYLPSLAPLRLSPSPAPLRPSLVSLRHLLALAPPPEAGPLLLLPLSLERRLSSPAFPPPSLSPLSWVTRRLLVLVRPPLVERSLPSPPPPASSPTRLLPSRARPRLAPSMPPLSPLEAPPPSWLMRLAPSRARNAQERKEGLWNCSRYCG
jgi:hypothetical protein